MYLQKWQIFSKIIDNVSVITCDKIIEETKEKKQPVKTKFLYFTCIFINHHCIIDRC